MCSECEDSGILYMFTRSWGDGTKYTTPIYCSCVIGVKKKADDELKRITAKTQQNLPGF